MVWEASQRVPPDLGAGEELKVDDDDDVIRPKDWGAVDIGHVTVLWTPSKHDENFSGLDHELQEISNKYQPQMDAAEHLHDEEVKAAEAKREADTNKVDLAIATKPVGEPEISAAERARQLEKVDKEYEVDVLVADDKLTTSLWSIGRKIEHDLAQKLEVVFENQNFRDRPTRFVLYRKDTDTWLEVESLQEAIEATTEAIDEYREFGERAISRIAVTQQFGRRGAIVARFDPDMVFFDPRTRGSTHVGSYPRRTNG